MGIERLVFESREYTEEPQEGEIPAILDRLEDRLAELLARRAVEERLERKISERLEEKHKEYVDEVKRDFWKKTKTMWKQHRAGIKWKSWKLWIKSV